MEPSKFEYLPPKFDFNNPIIWERTVEANRQLAKLEGYLDAIPSKNIILYTLGLQEAKHSSEIENIITTQEELYIANLEGEKSETPEAKEVKDYTSALMQGYNLINRKPIINLETICEIQRILKGNDEGIRKHPGTVIQNAITGRIVHVPPQDYESIMCYMENLLRCINDDDYWTGIDPLIKMAVIHYQFESIHPFYDGNGRTGRIINILYLLLKRVISAPVLYLSRYITEYKSNYYRLLEQIRTHNNWEEYILFMLDAVIETSVATLEIVSKLRKAMNETQIEIEKQLPKANSELLVDAIFKNVLVRPEHLTSTLSIKNETAKRYLEKLSAVGVLGKVKIKNRFYFVNTRAYSVLSDRNENEA